MYFGNPSLRAAVAARSDSAMADDSAKLSKLKEEENKSEEILKQFMESQKELDRLNSGGLSFQLVVHPVLSEFPEAMESH